MNVSKELLLGAVLVSLTNVSVAGPKDFNSRYFDNVKYEINKSKHSSFRGREYSSSDRSDRGRNVGKASKSSRAQSDERIDWVSLIERLSHGSSGGSKEMLQDGRNYKNLFEVFNGRGDRGFNERAALSSPNFGKLNNMKNQVDSMDKPDYSRNIKHNGRNVSSQSVYSNPRHLFSGIRQYGGKGNGRNIQSSGGFANPSHLFSGVKPFEIFNPDNDRSNFGKQDSTSQTNVSPKKIEETESSRENRKHNVKSAKKNNNQNKKAGKQNRGSDYQSNLLKRENVGKRHKKAQVARINELRTKANASGFDMIDSYEGSTSNPFVNNNMGDGYNRSAEIQERIRLAKIARMKSGSQRAITEDNTQRVALPVIDRKRDTTKYNGRLGEWMKKIGQWDEPKLPPLPMPVQPPKIVNPPKVYKPLPYNPIKRVSPPRIYQPPKVDFSAMRAALEKIKAEAAARAKAAAAAKARAEAAAKAKAAAKPTIRYDGHTGRYLISDSKGGQLRKDSKGNVQSYRAANASELAAHRKELLAKSTTRHPKGGRKILKIPAAQQWALSPKTQRRFNSRKSFQLKPSSKVKSFCKPHPRRRCKS